MKDKQKKLIQKIVKAIERGEFHALYCLRKEALKAGIRMGQLARECEDAGIDMETYETAMSKASRWFMYYPTDREIKKTKILDFLLRAVILAGLLVMSILAWKAIYG